MIAPVRCCYLILTHRNRAQVTRLCRAILSTSDASWIYLLQDVAAPQAGGATDLPRGRVIEGRTRLPVERGRLSMVEAFLDGLRFVRSHDPECEWLVFLSGQDFPLRPAADIERDLSNTPADALVRHWRVGSAESPWRPQQGRIRYHYQYRRLPDRFRLALRAMKWTHNIQQRWRVFTTYGADLGLRSRWLPFGPGLELHGGSPWCSLRRTAIDYLLEFCDRRRDVVDYYRRTMAAEESLVHTCLANAPADRIRLCGDHRRYVSAFGAGGHPRVLTIEDLPTLVASGCDFARKFDIEVDDAVVRRLEDRLREPGSLPDR